MDGIGLATGMTCKTINILKKERTVESVIHTGMKTNEYYAVTIKHTIPVC